MWNATPIDAGDDQFCSSPGCDGAMEDYACAFLRVNPEEGAVAFVDFARCHGCGRLWVTVHPVNGKPHTSMRLDWVGEE